MSDQHRSAGAGQARRGRLGFMVGACLASAALAAPIAIGATNSPLREGTRNPATGTATREALIIAKTGPNVYGTRQSNVGAGGAAIYGCRTTENLSALGDTSKSTPCLRANNLSTGLIFNYRFARGGVGGVYQAGPTTANDPRSRPFITNATGVATGLNAARVDSLDVDDIIASIRATGAGAQGPKGATGDKGPAGPAGPAGIAGSRGQWFQGPDSPPPASLGGAEPGDFYLDLVDPGLGNVFVRTSLGTWSPSPDGQNIRGPQGLPRTPAQIEAFQPYVDGVVANYCDSHADCDLP